MPISDSAPISTEQREALLRDFKQKHGLTGNLSVKRNKQAETGKNKVYELVLKSNGTTDYRAQLFVKQGKEVFTAKLLADSLAAHEQTESFRNFLSNKPQSLFDLNAQEAQSETAAEQPALTPAQMQKIQRNEAENRNFANQVSDLFDGNLRTDDVLRIGTTPFCLRIVGANAIPLIVTQSTIRNSESSATTSKHHTEGHDIPKETLASIPAALRNPVFVIKGNRPNLCNNQ